jgi:hypothetical protein
VAATVAVMATAFVPHGPPWLRRWCSHHGGVVVRQRTVLDLGVLGLGILHLCPERYVLCQGEQSSTFSLFVETDRRIPSHHAGLWVVYTVLASGKRIAYEYPPNQRLVKPIVSLLLGELCVCHATENSEMTET